MAVVTTQEGTIFVGGEFRRAEERGDADRCWRRRPASRCAEVGEAGVEDVDDAVAAAVAAQAGWAATGYDERAGDPAPAPPPPCRSAARRSPT